MRFPNMNPDLTDELNEEVGNIDVNSEADQIGQDVAEIEQPANRFELSPKTPLSPNQLHTAWDELKKSGKLGSEEHIKLIINNNLNPRSAISGSFERIGGLGNFDQAQYNNLKIMAAKLAPNLKPDAGWKEMLGAVRQGEVERVEKFKVHQERLKKSIEQIGNTNDPILTNLKSIIEKRVAVNAAKFEKESWQITRALQKVANPYGYDADINRWCTENSELAGQKEQSLRKEGRSLAQDFYRDYNTTPNQFFETAMEKALDAESRPKLGDAGGSHEAAQVPQAASPVTAPAPVRSAEAYRPPGAVPSHIRRAQGGLKDGETLNDRQAADKDANMRGAAAVRDSVGAIVQRHNTTMDPVAPLRDSAGNKIVFTSDQTVTMQVLEMASGVLQQEASKESSAYPHIDKLARSIETTASGIYSGNSRGGPDQASLDAYHVVADAAAWGLSPERNQGQHGQPAFFERPEYVNTDSLQPNADNNEVWARFAKETADDARRAARMGPAAFKAEGSVDADLKLARAQFAALRSPHAEEATVYEAMHESLRSLEAPDEAKPKDGAPPKPSVGLGHIREVMISYTQGSHAGDLQTRALAAVTRVAEWCTNHASRAVPETSMSKAGTPGPSVDRAGAARGMAELAQEAQAKRQQYQPEGKKVSAVRERAYDMQERGLHGARDIEAAARRVQTTKDKIDAWGKASEARATRTGDFADDGRRSVEAWKVKKPDAEEQGKGRSR